MTHEPIKQNMMPSMPMAFTSRLRKGADGHVFSSPEYAVVVEERPYSIGQVAERLARKTRDFPPSLIEYLGAATVFYRQSRNPHGKSRIPIFVLALEFSRLSTEFESVGILGRLLGRQPRPKSVMLGVFSASGHENRGPRDNNFSLQTQRDFLLEAAAKEVGLAARDFQLVDDGAIRTDHRGLM